MKVSVETGDKGHILGRNGDELSLRRPNMDAIGLILRPGATGLYYQRQFGGDEVIKHNIVAYGAALSVGKTPDFAVAFT